MHLIQVFPKKLYPVCVAPVEELKSQLSAQAIISVPAQLHRSGFNLELRPCMSQSDKWLNRQNKWLLQKQHFHYFPTMPTKGSNIVLKFRYIFQR